MNNDFINKIKGTYTLKIKGKNVSRFIKKIAHNRINILDIKKINYNTLYITIYKKDYEKILEIKTIYEVSLVNLHGFVKIKQMLKLHKVLLFSFIISLITLYILSNIIFSIEIVHNDKEIRELLKEELSLNGIKKYSFKKNYDQIQKIKKRILNKNKDKIEWLEIENSGTKYIVRVEERKRNNIEKDNIKNDVVAAKSAIVKKIDVVNGVSLKKVNDYVNKGEVVISGNIFLNENLKDIVDAKGSVYGEVWYKVRVTYPYHYKEEKETGNQNKVYTFKFLNKRFELFNKTPYKEKKIEEKVLWKDNLLPISLTLENQKEISYKENLYLEEEALLKAEDKAVEKMKKSLDKDEYIIDNKTIKVNKKESEIEIEVFFSVYENITKYTKVKEIKLEEETP